MISETKKMKTQDNIELNLEIIENGSPTWIIVNHGIGEHLGRHRYMFELFSQYFNICLYDLRGHGLSEGKRGHISDFRQFAHDLVDVKSFLKENYDMSRHIIFGHSMGGLIVSSYMQNLCDESFYPEKVFLSNPPVGIAGALGRVVSGLPLSIISRLTSLPVTLALPGLVDTSKLSHDPRVDKKYKDDEKNLPKLHTKLLLGLIKESRIVFARPLRVSCDLFCALASEDQVVSFEDSQKYFSTHEKNAKVKVFEGGYHELHNEVERFQKPYFEFLKSSLM